MTKEELVRGCMTVIEKLPEYDTADDLMISGVRAAISTKLWIESSPEGREEFKRELYRALKAGFAVKDVDDHLTREDLEILDECIERMESWDWFRSLDEVIANLKKVREL
ncbi:hypothetical protein LCGC14_0478300 [marine sediment metagenome]|uniref:Uncharacterized protein n=1 Tax=marine sediment metagenome TaxID=412755 RepID=A0A0F9SA81_9ZZZZ